jgi:hypothetical protein
MRRVPILRLLLATQRNACSPNGEEHTRGNQWHLQAVAHDLIPLATVGFDAMRKAYLNSRWAETASSLRG